MKLGYTEILANTMVILHALKESKDREGQRGRDRVLFAFAV